MATSDRTAPAPIPTGPFPGVTVDAHVWGVLFEGRKEDLIAAGVLREDWLPRVPEGKRKAVGTRRLPDGRGIHVRRRGAGDSRLVVAWHFTAEEEILEDAKRQTEREAEAARERAEREVAGWPTSREDFARRLEHLACGCLQSLHEIAYKGMGGGYRLAPKSMLAVNEKFLELVEALRDAEVVFDPAERAQAEALLRSKAASRDPAFGTFLDRVLEAPDEGEATA